jgi:TM2 domain-containing membrane protein YozV
LGCTTRKINPNFSLCPLKNIGINCPGCGLGRSISYALHGNFKQSLNTHPVGIPAIVILVHRILSLIIYHSKIHLKNKKGEIPMTSVSQLMPYLEGDEMVFIQGLIKDMTEDQTRQFATLYENKRKDPKTILIVTLLGFLGIAGIQRFLLNQIGMGLLYLFTAGLCFIGTIIDLVKYKELTFEYNSKIAQQVAVMVKGSN